jgi:hypothetical protein
MHIDPTAQGLNFDLQNKKKMQVKGTQRIQLKRDTKANPESKKEAIF